MAAERCANRGNLDGSSVGCEECNIDGNEHRRVIAERVGSLEAHGQQAV